MALATSSGSPIRCNGVMASICANASELDSNPSDIGVLIIPGNTALTLTPACPSSEAAALEIAAASELGHAGVRVNAVFPGIIRTPMSEGLESSSETLAQIEAMTPLQRIGEPEEVANAILFLASDEASFITGAELAIDGGYSAR